ncbi:MAG: hypothetical protein ACOWYE_00355 [Desulfatiglandales bacterium]
MISINATLVVQIIHFLILVFILNRLMIRPILKLIDERTEYIQKTKDEIVTLELETERFREELVSVQNDARKGAALERDQLRRLGLQEADQSLEESLAQVSSIRSKADIEAEKEVRKTQPLLLNEAIVLAEEIIERVIGRRIAA